MQDLVVFLWMILYTTMKVNRSQFITLTLVILLLCDDVAMPRRNARRHRAHRSHRSKWRSTHRCKPVAQTMFLTFPNCRKVKVVTMGCEGRCKSETSMLLKGRGIVPKCSCCKPDMDMQFRVFITCAGKGKVLRSIRVLAARSCSCYPCGNCALQFI